MTAWSMLPSTSLHGLLVVSTAAVSLAEAAGPHYVPGADIRERKIHAATAQYPSRFLAKSRNYRSGHALFAGAKCDVFAALAKLLAESGKEIRAAALKALEVAYEFQGEGEENQWRHEWAGLLMYASVSNGQQVDTV